MLLRYNILLFSSVFVFRARDGDPKMTRVSLLPDECLLVQEGGACCYGFALGRTLDMSLAVKRNADTSHFFASLCSYIEFMTYFVTILKI